MSAAGKDPPGIERVKTLARWFKKKEGLTHHEALDKAARDQGYGDYVHAYQALVPARSIGGGKPTVQALERALDAPGETSPDWPV